MPAMQTPQEFRPPQAATSASYAVSRGLSGCVGEGVGVGDSDALGVVEQDSGWPSSQR